MRGLGHCNVTADLQEQQEVNKIKSTHERIEGMVRSIRAVMIERDALVKSLSAVERQRYGQFTDNCKNCGQALCSECNGHACYRCEIGLPLD